MSDLYEDVEDGRNAGLLYEKMLPYFDIVEGNIVEGFKTCPIRDEDGLVLLRMQHQSLEAIKFQLQSVITTGKLADVAINQENDK